MIYVSFMYCLVVDIQFDPRSSSKKKKGRDEEYSECCASVVRLKSDVGITNK